GVGRAARAETWRSSTQVRKTGQPRIVGKVPGASIGHGGSATGIKIRREVIYRVEINDAIIAVAGIDAARAIVVRVADHGATAHCALKGSAPGVAGPIPVYRAIVNTPPAYTASIDGSGVAHNDAVGDCRIQRPYSACELLVADVTRSACGPTCD